MADPGRFVIAMTVAAFLAGCGDDGGGGASAEDQKAANEKKLADKKKAAADKKKKKTTKVKEEVASFIPTLERVVPREEASTIRRRLKERDFLSDSTGAENRDPFRSFLLPQLGSETQTTAVNSARPTDQCAKNKLVATSYAMRDLALLGIVVRGAQRFALFRDAKGEGHLVERGRCIGREKALVTEIGDGHVTVEIIPEATAVGVEPTPEKKSIPLYPNELTVETDDTEDTTSAPPTTTPAPAPVPPPPGAAENL